MDMISFGPTIQGPHSPDERASISSSQKILEISNGSFRKYSS
jgi:dipeptidase D